MIFRHVREELPEGRRPVAAEAEDAGGALQLRSGVQPEAALQRVRRAGSRADNHAVGAAEGLREQSGSRRRRDRARQTAADARHQRLLPHLPHERAQRPRRVARRRLALNAPSPSNRQRDASKLNPP